MYKSLVKLRSAVLVFLTHHMALPFLKLIRKPEMFPYSLTDLAAMPAGSAGNDLFIFLREKKLELLPYYAKHDLKHILLEYDTTDEGEVCLQAFMLGNGHLSFPVAATVLYGFITMPEHWKKFREAFVRGQNADTVHRLDWSGIVYQNTGELRAAINRYSI